MDLLNSELSPDFIRLFIAGVDLYDSSCSKEAKVYFIDKDCGYYLKIAPQNRLKREFEMTQFFHRKGLSAKVVIYISEERDWLLTEKIQGNNGIALKYLDHPKKLCDLFSERLSLLHIMEYSDCPIQNHSELYLNNLDYNKCNRELFPDNWGYKSAEQAWNIVKSKGHLLQNDTLLHGDYCLPNIILDDWCFSGFVDLDCAGVGDKHIDLFWGIWTLNFNLKTNKYKDRFLDAYGRDRIDEERLNIICAFEVFV